MESSESEKNHQIITSSALEEDVINLIEFIDNYPLPANFVHWISDGDFTSRLIQDQPVSGHHSRIVQYYVKEILIFTGKAEFYLDKINKNISHIFKNKQTPIYQANISEIEKRQISKTVADPYYTVISHLNEKDEIVGMSWEIYELPALVAIYRKKNDPLKYWRSILRE